PPVRVGRRQAYMKSAEKLIFFMNFFLCMCNHGYIRGNLSYIIQKIQNIKVFNLQIIIFVV
ncbi:hypothetical protein D1953_15975, partial [Peribacillus asahii]